MTGSATLWILAGAGLLTLVLKAAAEVRDKLVDDGWLSSSSWLSRSRRRALQRRIEPALAAVGVTGDHFDALRAAASVQAARRRAASNRLRTRPDQALLETIKPWVIKLEHDAAFRGNDRYVDTMGLVHYRAGGAPSLASIADSWLSLLQRHEVVPPFDCVVTLKEGNPVLVTEFCNRVSPTQNVKPILCKSRRDPSRIQRDAGSHETDFEGLRAFLDSVGPPQTPRTHYRAIALDDNCTSGASLSAAVSEFNDFVGAQPDTYCIEPIEHAVVLFVVKPGESSSFAFGDGSVQLHALLAIGSSEMEEIGRAKDVAGLADKMKGHTACASSAQLLGEHEPPPPSGAASQ